MPLTLPIDVIVPAYNAAAYLREALESVAAQTRSVNAIIVVDDGSTDETAQLARSLGASVISQPNRGIAEARNTGIRASAAPYVAFLDADDRWHPQRLEAQWRVCEARPDTLIIATDYARWSRDEISGSVLANVQHFRAVPREALSPDAFVVSPEAMLAALAVGNFVLPSSLLVDRRIFDRDGVYYCPRERLPESEATFVGEDYEWILRALCFTAVAFVDRVLVDYRQSPTTLSARRGRMRHGDVVLGEMIAAAPGAYLAGSADAFARTRARALRECAISHVRSGEFSFATARLRDLANCTPQPTRSFAHLGALLMMPPWVQRIIRPLTRLRRPRFLR